MVDRYEAVQQFSHIVFRLKGRDILSFVNNIRDGLAESFVVVYMYVLFKEELQMSCGPAVGRTFDAQNDCDLVFNAKRRLPDACQNHLQEKPEKVRKIDEQSRAGTDDGKPLQDLAKCGKKVNTTELDHTKQRYPSTRTSKEERKAHRQLPLKVKYESSAQRFSVPEFTSYKDLKMIVAKRMLENKVMAIEYGDDQGDKVVLSSDKDMAELSRISRERGVRPMQLCVSLWPR